MKILTLYLGRTLIYMFLMVTFIIACIFSFLALSEELVDVGQGFYDIKHAIFYVFLTLPSRMVDLSPMSALIATILTMGILLKHRELLIIKALGYSTEYIFKVFTVYSLLIALCIWVYLQFLGPPLGQYAYKMKARAIAVDVNILGAQGFWAKRDNMFLNVKQIKPGNMLEDVYIYNINKEWRLVSFIYAKEAIIKSHKKWVLRTATEKFITDEGIKIKNYSELEWKPFLTKNQSDLLYIPVSTLPLTELYSIIKAQKKGGENFRYNLTIFWQKCALPLSVIAMILVCLPFFVNRLPMRAEIGIEIAVSLVLGAVFYLFKYIIGYIVLLYDLDPFTLLMGPIVILLFIDMWLMQRATKVW